MFTRFDMCQATPEEARRPLPGDEVISHPIMSQTHAITIDAPPEQVWPWLVQLGCGRAGWYSYDLLDNGGRRSATTINPAWQHLAIGDVLPAVPGARDAFVVMDFTPSRMLLLGVPMVTPAGEAGESAPASAHVSYPRTMVYVLEETPTHHTRLITRGRGGEVPLLPSPKAGKPFLSRFAAPSELVVTIIMKLPRPAMTFLYRLAHSIMDCKHLVGIKQRAERLALVGSSPVEERRAAATAMAEPIGTGKVER
jgi:hypothetical protein